MATPDPHVEKWRSLKGCAAELAGRAERPLQLWTVVLRFYAALHLVQAYLGTKNPRFDARRHADRDKAIKASPELRSLRPAYETLKDLSERVRYDDANSALDDAEFLESEKGLAQVESILLGKLRGRGVEVD